MSEHALGTDPGTVSGDSIAGLPASDKLCDYRPQPRLLKAYKAMAGIGGVVFILGLVFAPQRLWGSVLMSSYFLVGLGLAGLFFIANGVLSVQEFIDDLKG